MLTMFCKLLRASNSLPLNPERGKFLPGLPQGSLRYIRLSEEEICALEEARILSVGTRGNLLKDYLAQDRKKVSALQHAFNALSEDEKERLRRGMSR
mgnify:FL=1